MPSSEMRLMEERSREHPGGAKNARTGITARWVPIWNSFLHEENYWCSECTATYRQKHDTCPWCGATMKGE
jgi:rubrerythrin